MSAYGKARPVPGAGGMTDADWRDIGGGWGDGIVGLSRSGASTAFSLVRSAATRDLTLALAPLRIRGIQFMPSQDTLGLTIPAIATAQTRRDRLLARYDPATTPPDVTFYVKTGVAVDIASGASPAFPGIDRFPTGAWEIPLYTFTGSNVPALQLDTVDQRVWVAQQLYGVTRPGLNTELNQGRPEGTTFLDVTTGHQWRQSNPLGVITWTDIDAGDYQPLNMGTTLIGGDEPPQYAVRRGRVYFKGEVGPRTGGWLTGNSKGLGQIPASVAPPFARAFPAFLTGASDGVRRMGGIVVGTDGQLTLDLNLPAGVTVTGVHVDSISYDLPGA
jgi:hypothetical protein